MLDSLVDFKTTPGHYLKTFLQQHADGTILILQHHSHFTRSSTARACLDTSVADFDSAKHQFLDSLKTNVETRFPSAPLISAMKMFTPSAYPTSKDSLSQFALDDFETLMEHYGTPKNSLPAYIDADAARTEYPMFKRSMYRYTSSYLTSHKDPPSSSDAMKALFNRSTGNQDCYPEIYKLFAACLVILVANAEAERQFSTCNRIKTPLRNRLEISTLDQLIRLSSCSKTLHSSSFFHKAAAHWDKTSHRF